MSSPAGEVRALLNRRLITYGLSVLALAVATPTCLLLETRYQTQWRQWQAKIAHEQSANDAAERRVHAIWTDLYRNGGGAEPTSAAAARVLGAAQTFPDDGQIPCIEPTTGGKVFLHFSNGWWILTTAASWQESVPASPRGEATYQIASVLRRLACITGYLICGVLLLLLARDWPHLARRGRVFFSIDLLAGSLFCIALSMLGPRSWRAWNEFVQDDSGGWGLLGAAIASLLLIAALVRRPRDRNLCRRCRYDLTGNMSGVCPECGTAR